MPGINHHDNCFLANKLNFEVLQSYMSVNCFSYLLLFSNLFQLDLLQANAKVFFLSSIAGSTSLRGKLKHNQTGGDLAYRLSKSALNCAVRNIAYDIQQLMPELTVVAVHPGWVQTTSGGRNATVSIESCVSSLLALMDRVGPELSGEFIDSDGAILLP